MTISLAVDQTLADKQRDIEDFVKQTVGWDESRNDKLTSTVVPFPPEPVAPPPTFYSYFDALREYGAPVAQVLSVGLALLFLHRLLLRSRKVTPMEISPQAGPAEKVQDPDLRKVRRDIEKAVAADPGAVTRLLQNWLVEKS
jgi:flagellar biosynthesis/type III secretory pathway M-ring protein FliF/YscJ